MTRPPEAGLPERLRDGSATEAERGWAVRRLGVLREFEAVIGLTPAEADELAALAAVLEGEASCGA